MLKIAPELIDGVKKASSLSDLQHYMQLAIELEHATIPPYLTAQFSIMNGQNQKIKELIHSVVIEEMLHMCIASNIVNALGGSPQINNPGFIPEYPGKLPMNIGDGLEVRLKKMTKAQVHDVFMKIEEPIKPIPIEKAPADKMIAAEAFVPEDFDTIGEFYDTMKKRILDLGGDDKLPGDPAKQVTSSFYGKDELFPIITKEDAARAIDIIVEQGEGATSPYDESGELAHYYKFYEIYEGRQIETIPGVPTPRYAFSGPVIPYDEEGVYNIFPDSKVEMLTEGTQQYRMAKDFAEAYNKLLNGLHQVFNGHPDDLSKTFGLMYDVKLYGEKLCATDFPGKDGYTIGPPFQYMKVPGSPAV
ncbi:MAG: ferritin-like protein [Bacteroidota bacterium]